MRLNRPERKNPLTFESYRELTDFFRACAFDDAVKAVVVNGAGGNFSSGGDVFEIIGPLVEMDTKGLTAFTRMTGDLVKAMRASPQPTASASIASSTDIAHFMTTADFERAFVAFSNRVKPAVQLSFPTR